MPTINTSIQRLLLCWLVGLAAVTVSKADTFNNFYSFQGLANGAQPLAGLVTGTDGNFYGTTSLSSTDNGATFIPGTVFRLTTSGSLTTLYRFGTNPNDGASPQASLIQGSDGNLYGTTGYTTYTGGALIGGGTVFKITLSGSLTTLHRFGTNPNDGYLPYGPLVEGTDQNLYGTTVYTTSTSGVSEGNGTIFQITTSGSLATIYTFGTNPNDGAGPYGGLLQGSDGNFYGTTAYTNFFSPYGTGPGTVFKVTASGSLATIYAFNANTPFGVTPTDGANPMAGLVSGSDGDFYGTTAYTYFTYNPDSVYGVSGGGGTVFKITSSGTLTTLYDFGDGVTDDGYQPSASLIQGSDGNFYGTTVHTSDDDRHRTAHGTVFSITPLGILTTLYTFGTDADDGTEPMTALVEGTDGNYYGTTTVGGIGGIGNVYEILTGTSPGSATFAANDDEAVIRGRAAIKIDVLANDTGPAGTPLEVTGVTQPLYGHVRIGPDNLIIYTPRIDFANFAGTDSFTYTLSGTSIAVVTVGNPFHGQEGRFEGNLGIGGAGELIVKVTGDGAFAGRLRVGAAWHGISGIFGADGNYSGAVAKRSVALDIGAAFPMTSLIPAGTMDVTLSGSTVSIQRVTP